MPKRRPRPWYEKVLAQMGAKGVTRVKLAGQIGASKSALSDWLNGKPDPPLGMAVKIAAALGLPFSYLVDDRASDAPITPEEAQDLIQELDENGRVILGALDDPKATQIMFSALQAYRQVVEPASTRARTDASGPR